MGLGALSASHPEYISMPGMHGSYAANMAMQEADLLVALGVRFDDRVTGQLASFARHAKVIHVDIDPAEVGKNRVPEIPIVGDVKRVLHEDSTRTCRKWKRNRSSKAASRAAWSARDSRLEGSGTRSTDLLRPGNQAAAPDGGDRPSFRRQAIVTSDVGQHQMWAAQLIRFNEPRLWLNSGGLGAMGFGLPSAMGAQLARPDKLVFRSGATAASRCRFRNWRPSRATACRSRSS